MNTKIAIAFILCALVSATVLFSGHERWAVPTALTVFVAVFVVLNKLYPEAE